MEARGANRTPPKAKHLLGTRRAIRTQLYPVIFFFLQESHFTKPCSQPGLKQVSVSTHPFS